MTCAMLRADGWCCIRLVPFVRHNCRTTVIQILVTKTLVSKTVYQSSDTRCRREVVAEHHRKSSSTVVRRPEVESVVPSASRLPHFLCQTYATVHSDCCSGSMYLTSSEISASQAAKHLQPVRWKLKRVGYFRYCDFAIQLRT